MKGLGHRLRRAVGEAEAAPPSHLATQLAEHEEALKRAHRRKEPFLRHTQSLEQACGGEAIETPYGVVWCITHQLTLDSMHGASRLGDFYERSLEDAERVTGDHRLASLVPEDACFLDIEATGLEHGAGTMAFIVGVAFRQGDNLITRQYLLREPSEERALLYCLLEDLDAHPLLITFNGKSYDLSVLETRLIICRFLEPQTCRLKLRPHLDLLHLSRNLHRGRWSDTRLGTLERHLLDFHRRDDMPGALVPSTWFHFLRTGDAGPLGQAVLHNLHDVWSMVALAERLLGTADISKGSQLTPRVRANLGHLLLRRREYQSAIHVLRPALAWGLEDVSANRLALDSLALAARRSRKTALEVETLQALDAAFPADADILKRLAIAYEHRARDIELALTAAREVHHLAPSLHSAKRIARLERKGLRTCSMAC